MRMLDVILGKLGYVRASQVIENLNFARSVGKRLDEHREMVDAIERYTELFDRGWWHVDHAARQDDYLMRLYHMVHGCWPDESRESQPTGEFVRQRPNILGNCELPEYEHKHNLQPEHQGERDAL